MSEELVIGAAPQPRPPTGPPPGPRSDASGLVPVLLPILIAGLALVLAVVSLVVTVAARQAAGEAAGTAARLNHQLDLAEAARRQQLVALESRQIRLNDAGFVLTVQNLAGLAKTQVYLVRAAVDRDSAGRITTYRPTAVLPQSNLPACSRVTFNVNDDSLVRTWRAEAPAAQQDPVWLLVWTDAWGTWQRVAQPDRAFDPTGVGGESGAEDPFDGPDTEPLVSVRGVSVTDGAAKGTTGLVEQVGSADLSTDELCA